jgi:glucokinase
MLCADYPTAEACIGHYLQDVGAATPAAAVLAVAGPVQDGHARLTNAQWQLGEAALQDTLGIRTVHLINDFAALAYATTVLGHADLAPIGPPVPGLAGATVAILGPGTGFGLAALAGGQDSGLLVTEGGHIGFAPTDPVEIELLRVLMRRYGRVSVERVCSGQGLANLHAARAEIAGLPPPDLDAAGITEAAEQGNADAAETVRTFCDILASTAGDLALALGAQGGIFIAGGIMPRLMKPHRLGGLDQAAFRARFEAKGRFADYLRAIPTSVVIADNASLRGAARAWAAIAP